MGRFLNYDSSASLNLWQRKSATAFDSRRVPLVFGTDVFVKPGIVSHKITTYNGELVHQCIAVVSYGKSDKDITGEIGKIDSALYSEGIKLRNGGVIDTRSGESSSPVYPSHSFVYRSIKINGTQVTVPSRLPDGTEITNGLVFYKAANGAWTSISGVPGQTITTPLSATWISLATKTEAIFKSLATALTQFVGDDFIHPDVYVREGKKVERLIAAGTGAYQKANEHVVNGSVSYLLTSEGKRYQLPLDSVSSPVFKEDSTWVVTRIGISDRFPDVVNALLTTSAGGGTSDIINHSLIDYQSFVLANAHVDRLGLKLSGVIDSAISVIDFVTDYSCWFDLITIRKRNAFGLLPDSTSETFISAIFTPFNSGDMAKIFESNSRTSFSQIGTFIGENLSPITVPVDSSVVVGNQHYIDSAPVCQNSVQIKQQLTRIAKSVNSGNISVSITAPVGVREVSAGDFIIADCEYFTDRRSYIGGIIRTNVDDLYSVIIYDSVYTFINAEPIVAGFLKVDSKARRDGLSQIRVSVGDYVLIEDRSKTITYCIVEDTDIAPTGTSLNLTEITWSDSDKKWNKKTERINRPEDSTIKIYRFGDIPESVYFYDDQGVPRKSSVVTTLEPDSQSSNSLVSFLKFINYSGTVASATPVIFDKDVTLWRVSQVEPISRNIMGKSETGNRRNQGYNISATIYSGAPKTYAPLVLPPSLVVDTKVTVTPPKTSSSDVIDYILELAIGNEFDKNVDVTHKWRPGAIVITPTGADSDDLVTIDQVIDELSQLTGLTLSVGTTNSSITITFADEATFSTIIPSYPGGNLGYFDAVISATAPLDITSGAVLIDNTNKVTRAERNHLIREELTQLITGLTNDSYRYADSIFQQRWTQVQGYSDIDKQAIRLFAHSSITSGMNAVALRAAIALL